MFIRKQQMKISKAGTDGETYLSLLFMHSPMQMKYAAKTAHGARDVQEKRFPPERLKEKER